MKEGRYEIGISCRHGEPNFDDNYQLALPRLKVNERSRFIEKTLKLLKPMIKPSKTTRKRDTLQKFQRKKKISVSSHISQ